MFKHLKGKFEQVAITNYESPEVALAEIQETEAMAFRRLLDIEPAQLTKMGYDVANSDVNRERGPAMVNDAGCVEDSLEWIIVGGLFSLRFSELLPPFNRIFGRSLRDHGHYGLDLAKWRNRARDSATLCELLDTLWEQTTLETTSPPSNSNQETSPKEGTDLKNLGESNDSSGQKTPTPSPRQPDTSHVINWTRPATFLEVAKLLKMDKRTLKKDKMIASEPVGHNTKLHRFDLDALDALNPDAAEKLDPDTSKKK